MKKVSILLLLTVVFASFAFGIDGIGDFTGGVEFGFDNVSGANDTALSVSIEPSINFVTAFGGFGLDATVGDVVYIDTDSDNEDKIGDELYVNVTPSFTFAVGPGDLGIQVGLQLNLPLAPGFGLGYEDYGFDTDSSGMLTGDVGKDLNFSFDPAVNYGLDAGFAALSFELGTDGLRVSKTHLDGTEYAYGLDDIPLYFLGGAEFSFGLGFWVQPFLGLGINEGSDTELTNIDFDIYYAITEQISAGIEASIPTVTDGIKDEGITIIPHCDLSFGALSAWVQIELSHIAAQPLNPLTGDREADAIQIKPIVGVSYSF
jgi:hypothetical protein